MKCFKSIFSDDYYKISKEDWENVELIVKRKQDIIDTQSEIISQIKAELSILKKYKENDDLLYACEKENEKIHKQNHELREGIKEMTKAIDKISKKVEISRSIESVHIQEINRLRLENAYHECPKYRTVGADFKNKYA